MDGEQEAVDLSMVVQAAADPADLQVPAVGDLPSHPAVLEEGGCAATVIDLARLQSPEGISACPGCGKEMRRSQLAIHMRKKDCESFSNQLPSIPFLAPVLGRVKCPSCEHVSPNLKALRKHYASLHGEKKSCAKCSKQYGRSDALRKHERTCGLPPDPTWACVCSPTEPYKSFYNLKAHIKRETAANKEPAVKHERVALPDGYTGQGSGALLAVAAAAQEDEEQEEAEQHEGEAPAAVEAEAFGAGAEQEAPML